ncbi:hypothetical protein V8D89_002356 [Ganoderma adspersum]
MSLTDSHSNPNASDDVDAVYHAATTTGQEGQPVSPWTASLPLDILGKIFVDVRDMIQADHPDHQSGWLCLTRVCRSWRRAVLTTPALWTRVRIYDTKYPGELKLLLARSIDLPVDVELDFVKRRSLASLDLELSIKLAVGIHGHRITTFSVVCSSKDMIPIRSTETTVHFPNGTEVFFEPQTGEAGSVVRLQGGGFPKLYELMQDGEANHDTSKVFRAVGTAQRHGPADRYGFWQDFGLQIPLVLLDFWTLTHLHLEYCGPRDRQGSVMEVILLPPSVRTLTIKDEPWEMQTLLSHISIPFDAEDCEDFRIKLAVDLQNPMYRPQSALRDLLCASRWPSIYYHISVCTTVLLNLAADDTLTLAGFDIEQRSKFQFDFFDSSDESAIQELAADTLNNYLKLSAPPGVLWFSNMRQLSIHDASGGLGRLLDWNTLLSCLPLHVRSLSLGNQRVVADFLVAMDRLARWNQEVRDSGSSIKTDTLCLSRLEWCVNRRSPTQLSKDVAVIMRCRDLGVLDVEEIVLRVARVDLDELTAPDNRSSPLPSPPPSNGEPPSEDGAKRESKAKIRIRFEDMQTTNVEPGRIEDPRACPLATAMDAWDDLEGVWEDYIWNMAASYNDADWTYIRA